MAMVDPLRISQVRAKTYYASYCSMTAGVVAFLSSSIPPHSLLIIACRESCRGGKRLLDTVPTESNHTFGIDSFDERHLPGLEHAKVGIANEVNGRVRGLMHGIVRQGGSDAWWLLLWR